MSSQSIFLSKPGLLNVLRQQKALKYFLWRVKMFLQLQLKRNFNFFNMKPYESCDILCHTEIMVSKAFLEKMTACQSWTTHQRRQATISTRAILLALLCFFTLLFKASEFKALLFLLLHLTIITQKTYYLNTFLCNTIFEDFQMLLAISMPFLFRLFLLTDFDEFFVILQCY